MADRTLAGVRIQDWVGMAMVVVGAGLLIWFSWQADPLAKLGLILLVAIVVVLTAYRTLRDRA